MKFNYEGSQNDKQADMKPVITNVGSRQSNKDNMRSRGAGKKAVKRQAAKKQVLSRQRRTVITESKTHWNWTIIQDTFMLGPLLSGVIVIDIGQVYYIIDVYY